MRNRKAVLLCNAGLWSRQVPARLALLNSAVLAFMDVLHVSTVAAQRRRLAAFPAEALRLFLEDL